MNLNKVIFKNVSVGKMRLNSVLWKDVMFLKKLIFNSFYFGRVW